MTDLEFAAFSFGFAAGWSLVVLSGTVLLSIALSATANYALAAIIGIVGLALVVRGLHKTLRNTGWMIHYVVAS